MGLITDCKCIFCDDPCETREHLFIKCPVAEQLWNVVFSHSGLHFTVHSWDALIAWACSTWKGKSLLTSIMKLGFTALIYILWDERNKPLFQGRFRNSQDLFHAIKDIVRLQLRDRNINRNDNVNITLVEHWDIY
ncbi:uncharacterized protein LOC120117834 [Hibiscus syriacus]|uniref:uncharacterized protein LOC120117834 n=1 Tax=Hibiscus syriacus TaxID=106335 RepID=UPI0019214549|nr:uncharacterized protein LOC120117834 [Hibiscus syriacus]